MPRVIGARRRVVTYQYYDKINDFRSSFLFSDVPIGDPAPGRLIVVGTGVETIADPGPVRIDGVECTQLTDVVARSPAELWSLEVATGTTADIRVGITGGSAPSCNIGVWSVYNLQSNTAHDAALDEDAVTLSVPNRGVVIAINKARFGSSNYGPATWTGVTEDFDDATALNSVSGGSISGVASDATYSVTSTLNSGIGWVSAASWS